MEGVQETGDLYEWIGDNNRCALLVRGETETADHLIEVSVDWSPDFYAAELPSPSEVDPKVPSCEWPSCRHPSAKHTAEGCGVLHCRCKCSPLPEAALSILERFVGSVGQQRPEFANDPDHSGHPFGHGEGSRAMVEPQ